MTQNSPGTVKLIVYSLLIMGVGSLLVGFVLSWRHIDAAIPFTIATGVAGALGGLLAHTGSTAPGQATASTVTTDPVVPPVQGG